VRTARTKVNSCTTEESRTTVEERPFQGRVGARKGSGGFQFR
jgi:hypothetical protein